MTTTRSSNGHPTAGSRERFEIDSRQREALLDEFERSGVTAKAFARQHGIKYSTFTSWVRKRQRRRDGQGASQSISLAEVVVEGRPQPAWDPSSPLRIHLPGGAWVEFDGQEAQSRLLAQLLRSLNG